MNRQRGSFLLNEFCVLSAGLQVGNPQPLTLSISSTSSLRLFCVWQTSKGPGGCISLKLERDSALGLF